jgi:hypothetical protein
MNTKNILTETLTCNDAWGKTRYATIEWIPKEVTGYDASLANVGIRTFAWDDQPPVFLVRAQHGQVRMVKNVLRFDGTISQVVSPTRVESREDLEPGTYFIAHQN